MLALEKSLFEGGKKVGRADIGCILDSQAQALCTAVNQLPGGQISTAALVPLFVVAAFIDVLVDRFFGRGEIEVLEQPPRQFGERCLIIEGQRQRIQGGVRGGVHTLSGGTKKNGRGRIQHEEIQRQRAGQFVQQPRPVSLALQHFEAGAPALPEQHAVMYCSSRVNDAGQWVMVWDAISAGDKPTVFARGYRSSK